ncbi:MAG: substrate-binding domain-containing protein, partial [Anaerolineae bacterium]|nr:substrate-binding domain-containing protein [Anaerolineae bacterium]
DVPSIQFDRQHAAYQATQHLLASGRSRVAYIGPEDQRVTGYQQALWEAGIPVDERLIIYGVDPESGHDCGTQLVEAGVMVDAVCTGTDEVAMGVLKCLHQRGLRVPQDIAVASIDNLEISAFMIPSLTTVDVPKREIGLHAVDILVANKPRQSSAAFAITVRTQLIVRDSSLPA